MLHVYGVMPTPHDVCHKELGLTDELVKSMAWKGRGRTMSDELSTAAPSPEASPLFGPQKSTPLDGPEELLLPDLGAFQLPDAQDYWSGSGSDAEFELAGFDDEECTRTEFALTGLKDEDSDVLSTCSRQSCGDEETSDIDEDEDIESQILDLLGELSALRAEARQQHESESSLVKIPYPQLESGFLPAEFMPTQSWLMPPGRAETGNFACAMAPRPGISSMEPVDIVFGEAGLTLEVKPRTDECSSELERKRASKAKAVFRRRPGRSRSPIFSMDEKNERGVSEDRPRGRPRLWTHG